MSVKNHPAAAIAMFIAASLQHQNPPCNSRHRRISTISVEQHKDKFGLVVVYCDLAAPHEVNAKWLEEGNVGEPTIEYVKKCLDNDARHYRNCYRSMLELVPQHREMILSRPDYGYLLYDTVEELYACLDMQGEHMKEPYGAWHFKRWDVDNMNDLKARLCKVCGFR